MAKKRNARSASFKAKVAFEAIRERMTINEIAKESSVHSTQIHQWQLELQTRYSTGRNAQPWQRDFVSASWRAPRSCLNRQSGSGASQRYSFLFDYGT